MQAVIKHLYSTDIPDLNSYQPEIDDCFGFPLRLIVGPRDDRGEESFDLLVATPKWLLDNYSKDDIVIGRHYLIVFHYDFRLLSTFLQRYVSDCRGDTWEEIASKVSRIGYWEFEDYRSA